MGARAAQTTSAPADDEPESSSSAASFGGEDGRQAAEGAVASAFYKTVLLYTQPSPVRAPRGWARPEPLRQWAVIPLPTLLAWHRGGCRGVHHVNIIDACLGGPWPRFLTATMPPVWSSVARCVGSFVRVEADRTVDTHGHRQRGNVAPPSILGMSVGAKGTPVTESCPKIARRPSPPVYASPDRTLSGRGFDFSSLPPWRSAIG